MTLRDTPTFIDTPIFIDTPTFIGFKLSDMVESVADPDWKKSGVQLWSSHVFTVFMTMPTNDGL